MSTQQSVRGRAQALLQDLVTRAAKHKTKVTIPWKHQGPQAAIEGAAWHRLEAAGVAEIGLQVCCSRCDEIIGWTQYQHLQDAPPFSWPRLRAAMTPADTTFRAAWDEPAEHSEACAQLTSMGDEEPDLYIRATLCASAVLVETLGDVTKAAAPARDEALSRAEAAEAKTHAEVRENYDNAVVSAWRASLSAVEIERDRLARILAVERGDEGQAPEGWVWCPVLRFWSKRIAAGVLNVSSRASGPIGWTVSLEGLPWPAIGVVDYEHALEALEAADAAVEPTQ
jgi:hypothetical protein